MTQQEKLSGLLDLYLNYLDLEKNYSPKTIENYKLWIGRFIDFLGDVYPGDITSLNVLSFRNILRKRGLNIKTINYHIIALRAFIKFLTKNDIDVISHEKLEIAKTPPREVNFLKEKEIEILLKSPESFEKNPIKKLRDIAILHVLYGSGLRVTELITLQAKDIDFETGQFWVVWKWKKMRAVFATANALTKLKNFLDQSSFDAKYVFNSLSNNWASLTSKHLTRVAIECLVKRYAKLVWIEKKVTPHTLRHSFATSLLMKWADIRSVQMLLWHSSITTTQIYTHVADSHLKKVHELLNL